MLDLHLAKAGTTAGARRDGRSGGRGRWGALTALVREPPPKEKIDNSSAAGELVFYVLGAIAHFERRLISERTKDGIAAARAKGREKAKPTAARHEKGRGSNQTDRGEDVPR
jgi:DNA invertase Pin-like site-specific DNA recombinase